MDEQYEYIDNNKNTQKDNNKNTKNNNKNT